MFHGRSLFPHRSDVIKLHYAHPLKKPLHRAQLSVTDAWSAQSYLDMSPPSASTDHQIRTVTVDGQRYFVCLRVGYDGIEHVGRLRFTDMQTEVTYQDH